MAGSDITVSSLVAVGDVKGNKLAWVVTDPWPKDMRTSLDAVELWAATSNDRAHGSFAKVGEGLHDFSHAGLNRGDVRYYWAKARNKYGSYGPWHPSGATSGVVGTEVSGDVLLAENGYWKHPSGLIMQWGYVIGDANDTVAFPIPFPSTCFSLMGVPRLSPAKTEALVLNIGPVDATGFTADTRLIDNTGAAVSDPGISSFSWFALGY